ncbi:UNVERIFIED_CONTAM: hypothetical protein GTU68_020387, partial [Idotea baltica]|nr:hypothetical protein [Idotea baltica]
FTTTVWVVDRVHDDTTNRRALAIVAHTAGFTHVLVGVVRVGHGTNGGHAFLTHEAKFTRAQTDLGVTTVTTYELGVGAGCACDLPALAWLHFDVVDDCPDGHARKRHGVARLDVCLGGRDDLIADSQTLWCDDIGLFAICVLNKGDERGAVRVIFDPSDDGFHIHLVTFEIYDAVKAFCPTTTTT